MANQPVGVKPSVEKVDKEEALIQIRQEKDRADALEIRVEQLQNEIYSTRRLEALDLATLKYIYLELQLAIRLNPAQADLISLAEQIYQFLTKDLTGNKI